MYPHVRFDIMRPLYRSQIQSQCFPVGVELEEVTIAQGWCFTTALMHTVQIFQIKKWEMHLPGHALGQVIAILFPQKVLLGGKRSQDQKWPPQSHTKKQDFPFFPGTLGGYANVSKFLASPSTSFLREKTGD